MTACSPQAELLLAAGVVGLREAGVLDLARDAAFVILFTAPARGPRPVRQVWNGSIDGHFQSRRMHPLALRGVTSIESSHKLL